MGLFDRKSGEERAEPREKRADFSNVEGSSSSTAPEAPAQDTSGRSYTVVAGDSLSRIAERELGDASKWRRIFEANRTEIDDPDRIFPGQVLKLPPRE